MSKLKILDLCSGIGGFSLGLEATGGFETIAFCEFDPFCQKVLNKHWPEVPIYNDLKEISKNEETIRNIPEHDLICGGIPCQPFSVAGKQKGKEDDRHLWPFMFKIIEQKKPTWVIVENVGGFVNVALDDVCLDLEAEGYSTQSFIIPACGVEAPHRRDRIWIIGKRDVVDSDSTRTGHGHGEVQGENGEVQQRNDHAESNHASEKQDETTTESRQSLVNSDSFRSHEHKEAEKESSRRGAEATTTTTSEDVADTKGNQHQRELRDGKQKNGEKKKRGKSDRRGSQLSNRSTDDRRTEDVADSKSSDRDDDEVIKEHGETKTQEVFGNRSSVSRTFGNRSSVSRTQEQYTQHGESNIESGLGGMVDGLSSRLDRHYGFQVEPNIPRITENIPNRVDRLKSLGNAIVPQIIYHIGLAILKEEE
jgi:DNA (cytosine-5)-methyltransferase 1